jgi:hypothetical protein
MHAHNVCMTWVDYMMPGTKNACSSRTHPTTEDCSSVLNKSSLPRHVSTMTDAKENSDGPLCSPKRNKEDMDLDGEDKELTQQSTKRCKHERKTISVKSSASVICEAFFKCMDFDGNGFIEESESKILSVVAFGKGIEEAEAHWNAMLATMDKDHDKKISQEEYVLWWTGRHAKESINEDGTFIEDYASYLLECLQRISSVKVAQKMCDAFFEAIDYNHGRCYGSHSLVYL